MSHRCLLFCILATACGRDTVSNGSSGGGGRDTDSPSSTEDASTSGSRGSEEGASSVGTTYTTRADTEGITTYGETTYGETTDGETTDGEETSTGIVSTCGDTIVDADELCDDGNHTDGDNCAADCSHPGIDWHVIDDSVRVYHGLALTTDNAIFVSSIEEAEFVGGTVPVRLHKFDTNGNELWSVLVLESRASTTDLVSDGMGNAIVLVTGYLSDEVGAGDRVAKYDGDGNLVWAVHTQGSYGRFVAATEDFVFLLRDLQGTSIVSRWNSEGASAGPLRILNDERYMIPLRMATTEDGFMAVVGTFHSPGTWPGFVAWTDWNVEPKSAGEPFTIDEYEPGAPLSELAQLPDGRFAVTTQSDWARCFDGSTPTPCWLETDPPRLWRLAAGRSGQIAGISDEDQVSSYDSHGNAIAAVDLNFTSDSTVSDLGVDSNGAVVGVGRVAVPGATYGMLFKTAWGDSR